MHSDDLFTKYVHSNQCGICYTEYAECEYPTISKWFSIRRTPGPPSIIYVEQIEIAIDSQNDVKPQIEIYQHFEWFGSLAEQHTSLLIFIRNDTGKLLV